MRLSKAWIIAARDFKIFRRVKNVWYSIIVFPVIISVLFPVILEYTAEGGATDSQRRVCFQGCLTPFPSF